MSIVESPNTTPNRPVDVGRADPPKQRSKSRRGAKDMMPKVSKQISGFFSWFVPKYLGRNFHVVGLLKRHNGCGCVDVPDDEPIIIALNHPSWWDPLIGLLFADHCFDNRQFYAPIDAEALANYRIFEKLGFYGVDARSPSGVKEFLKTSREILSQPGTSIWITPEGRFTDVRDNADFEPGLGHLLSRLDRGVVIPLAAEYTFWEEKLPVALAAFGDPISITEHASLGKDEWSELVREQLRDTQSELAAASIARAADRFDSVLVGKVGVGGIYDWGRRIRCWLTRQEYTPQHGTKFHKSS